MFETAFVSRLRVHLEAAARRNATVIDLEQTDANMLHIDAIRWTDDVVFVYTSDEDTIVVECIDGHTGEPKMLVSLKGTGDASARLVKAAALAGLGLVHN